MRFSRRDLFNQIFQSSIQSIQSIQSPQAEPRDPAVHFLNRTTFGPRPQEVARIQEIGLEAYLEEQLHPDQINDEIVDRKLHYLPLLRMSREEIYRLGEEGGYRAYRVVQQGIVTRAIYSERQLLERMTAFWRDHFNIYSGEEITVDLVHYEEDVLRPHALGRFRDLLIATAKSPAMLIYLDNFVNLAADPNENYARELLELHTLGVDGGHYTEEDVREVARAFTGWTTHVRGKDGFWFDPENHDRQAKTILGHSFPAGRGLEDGLHVLSILANHPATARFLSHKLCTHFVSDRPPASLVESTTAVWQASGGEIKAVLRHIFLSDRFAQAQGEKLKRPFEHFIAMLRATGTQITGSWQLDEMLQRTQQPPYGWPAPNGYPDVAPAWISTSGLLQRWNLAMQLSHGAYSDPYDLGSGLQTDLHQRIGQPTTVNQLVDEVSRQIFGTPLTGTSRARFIDYTADGGNGQTAVTPHLLARKLGSLYGLMMASPQFMWH